MFTFKLMINHTHEKIPFSRSASRSRLKKASLNRMISGAQKTAETDKQEYNQSQVKASFTSILQYHLQVTSHVRQNCRSQKNSYFQTCAKWKAKEKTHLTFLWYNATAAPFLVFTAVLAMLLKLRVKRAMFSLLCNNFTSASLNLRVIHNTLYSMT